MDAFTAKECICFNIKVLDEHLPIAMDVLSDLVLHPVFNPEISPVNAVSFSKKSRWTRTIPTTWCTKSSRRVSGRIIALGLPILGTRETVKRFERPVVHDYYRPLCPRKI